MKTKKEKRKNFYPKLISFITAIFLWIFIDNITNMDKTITLPLYLINIPPRAELHNLSKQIIKIHVKGNKDIINTVSSKNIIASIDLKTVSEGTNIEKIKINRKKLPNSVSIWSTRPKKIIIIRHNTNYFFIKKEKHKHDKIRR